MLCAHTQSVRHFATKPIDRCSEKRHDLSFGFFAIIFAGVYEAHPRCEKAPFAAVFLKSDQFFLSSACNGSSELRLAAANFIFSSAMATRSKAAAYFPLSIFDQ